MRKWAPRLLAVAAFALLLLALARATLAGAPPGRYVLSGSSAVYDTKTKLTWQRTPPSFTCTWGDASTLGSAQSYCATLQIGGVAGWRLPTVNELQTLIDFSQTGLLAEGGPAAMVDTTFFESEPTDIFWSSTPYVSYPGFAWGVNFSFGNANGYSEGGLANVRCVR